MFFWNSLDFSMLQQMLAIWSLVPLPFLKPAWTSGSSWFTYCWTVTSNTEESEVEWFYEDLQDLLELTPKKDVLFIISDWNAKVRSQETPGVTGKFSLGIWNEAGQRLIEFCQENTLVIANTGLMLKLKLQYFGHLMQTTDSLEKTLMLGKIEGRRRRGR